MNSKNKTISDKYLTMQKELHKNVNYGVASIAFAPIVADLCRQINIKTISDYGAGKKRLQEALIELDLKLAGYFPYDPAFPEYGEAKSAELVCCIDVLEHVEPDKLTSVLEELASITSNYGFFSVHMGPAEKILEDGRNAHLIQEQTSWWLPRLCCHFNILQLMTHTLMGRGFWVVVERK
jgi:hypothetical protein